MYLRKTQRRNGDGSVVRYLQLANNRRLNGTTQAEVLVNLGREDKLDVAALRRLVASINRYLGDEDDVTLPLGTETGPLTVEQARPFGAIWLLDQLWHTLEVDKALAKVLGPRRFRTDIERIIFALVANRAVAPSSKLAAAEWITHTVAIPGLDHADKDQAMRAMDLLAGADAQSEVQQAVFFAAANLLNLEVDLILFDSTSTYFERDGEPEPDTDDEPGLRRFGHSKDHRRDLPQIVIGLAVTREGIPVRCRVWPGNTNDMTVLEQVKDDLRDWRLGRVVTVVDSGFSSRENMAYLQRAGGHYICGVKMRDGSAESREAMSRQGRYLQVRDNLRVKEVKLAADQGRRWIICHNPIEAERDQARRQVQLQAITAELDRIAAARTAHAAKAKAKAAQQGKKKTPRPSDAPHRKAECALRDHPSLGRWLKQHPTTGRLSIDAAKVKAEANYDGKYLIATSDPDLSPEDIALGYKNLLQAEAAFRTMKTTLDLRPVYHRLDERIVAHVLLCWLALLLIRVAERSTGQTWPSINRELGRVHQVTLSGPAGRLQQTTKLTPSQAQLYKDCAVALPPKMSGLQPAE
ncbi:IS1634 family transposase [Nonomuraea mesophila]|uniref:IS1634 family transposase n=1 Tax=Nonomuraea mesophila TaxID=2530382 RepID=A0A4R5F2H4_9ACTN|nr:IS1634 family transposase [Nonomuraea mesophila]TDE41643.1 IS1634 family transposase [Nonomuraea mesophila]